MAVRDRRPFSGFFFAQRASLHGARALSFAMLAFLYLGRAAGFGAADWWWALTDVALAGTLVTVGAGIWAGWRWVGFFGLGFVGHLLLDWVGFATRLPARPDAIWVASGCVFALACTFAVASCSVWPRRGERRHALALLLAGAALRAAIHFAGTPGQPGLVAASVLLGTGGIIAGSFGIGIGRTWGLLLVFSSASILIVGVGCSPDLVTLSASHPWFPGPAVTQSRLAGVGASVLGTASAGLYVAPIARFLRRSGVPDSA